MKTKIIGAAAIFTICFFLISSCEKKNDDPNVLSGSQSPIGSVNNTFYTSVSGITNVNAKVTELNGGISKVTVSGTLTDSTYKALMATIPNFTFGTYDPASGAFTADVKMKFASDGIQDLANTGGRTFTIVKYDAKVGDTYTCEKANGGTFTRTVTAVTNVDDFPYGFYLIKTITTEEPGRNPAINKVIYKTNHRFGLVAVGFELQDGSSFLINLYSSAEN
ncbi:MAG: hypothetical protein WCO63_07375 [Bacteroidota bacterium]